MPGGRPTKYKPEYCGYENSCVVYGLCDELGRVFYVGKTKNLKSRLRTYHKGNFHGNKALQKKVEENGLWFVILDLNPENLTETEMRRIQGMEGLVNIVVDNRPFFHRSRKPWVVKGAACPTKVYQMHMRNAFGARVVWLSDMLKTLNDKQRLAVELRFAKLIELRKPESIRKWMAGLSDEVMP